MRVIDGWLEEFLASQRPNLLWERCIRTNEVNFKKAFYLKGTERTAFVKKYCTDAFNCADFNTDTLRFGLFLLLLCNNEDIDPIPMIRHSTKLTEALCREPLSDECSLGDPKIIEILLFYKRCFDSEKCMLTPLSVK